MFCIYHMITFQEESTSFLGQIATWHKFPTFSTINLLLFGIYHKVPYRCPCPIRSAPCFSVMENQNDFMIVLLISWQIWPNPLETWFIKAYYVYTNHNQLHYLTIFEITRDLSSDLDRHPLELCFRTLRLYMALYSNCQKMTRNSVIHQQLTTNCWNSFCEVSLPTVYRESAR